MWIFLSTEVLFFGAMLLGYSIYRSEYSTLFAESSRHLNIILGTVNTAVLLCSSLTVVFAVHESQRGNHRALIRYLGVTVVFGVAFLGIKFYEYYEKFVEGFQANLFYVFYFTLTGMHALHMFVGIGLLLLLSWRAHKREFSPEYYTPVEMGGLYWHFVDIVWVFLFPLLYLVDRSS